MGNHTNPNITQLVFKFSNQFVERNRDEILIVFSAKIDFVLPSIIFADGDKPDSVVNAPLTDVGAGFMNVVVDLLVPLKCQSVNPVRRALVANK